VIALLLTLAALSIWLYQDAQRRQMRSPLAWVVMLILLGPLALAVYWARRPLFRGEYRAGGRVWVMLRTFLLGITAWILLFIAVLMVWLSAFLPMPILLALFMGLGLLVGGAWLFIVAGLLFAAWLMRDTDDLEIGPTHQALAGAELPVWGDRLLKVIFFIGLIGVFVLTEPVHPDWVERIDWQSQSTMRL
jgi:hypothetical protein